MKITIYIFILLLSCFTNASAQSKNAPIKDTSNYKIQKTIYQEALKLSDLSVAKNAIYTMMALNPSDKSLKDSLLYIYFNGGSFAQCILLSRELLAENPKGNVLEIKAISEQNIGLIKESLDSYEKLYSQTKNIYHQYQIAVLQYQLRRFGECSQNLEAILNSKESISEKVNINNGQDQQQVVIKAAALNIKGVMLLEGKRDEEAKAIFKEALAIQPDFVLAKTNLDLVSKKKTPQVPVKKGSK